MTRIWCPALLAVAAAVLLAVPRDAVGCAAVPHDGERVNITDESALIVWDEANKTEHFIRRASFQSTAYDFGFLVPTPHRPELGEVKDDVFNHLANTTAPRVETVKRTVFPTCGMFQMGSKGELAGSAERDGVVLLDQGKVGEFDYAVLAFRPGAKDADPAAGAAELAKWLRDNAYPFSPTLADWLKPYVRDGWIVTAFKVAGQPRAAGAGNGGTATGRSGPAATRRDGPRSAQQVNGLRASAVRMSFKVDRPFFPYREPADQRDERAAGVSRSLRVYFVGPQRFAGKLGDGSVAWPGKTMWANKLSEAETQALASEVKLPAGLSGEWWLTEFEDRSSPRPGDDEVYFEPSPDQSSVARPPIVHYVDDPTPWLIGFVVALPLALVVALLILRWVSRKQ